MLSTMNRECMNRPCASIQQTHAQPVVSRCSSDSGCFVSRAGGHRNCVREVERGACTPLAGSLSSKVSAEIDWGLPMEHAGESEVAERLVSEHRRAEFPPRLGRMCGDRPNLRASSGDRARSESPALGAGCPVLAHGEASRLRLPCNNQLQGTPPSYLPFVVTLRPVVRGTSRGGSWGAPEACRYTASH